MKKPQSKKRFLLLFLLLGGLALLVAAPLLISYERYLPGLQTALGQRLQGKVEVGRMSFRYLPNPAFTLEQVRIDGAEQARIERIIVPVTAQTFFSGGKEIDTLRVDQATFSLGFARSLPVRFAAGTRPELQLRNLILSGITLKLAQEQLGPLDALLTVKPDGSLENLTVQFPNTQAALQIQPGDTVDTFLAQFRAKDWTLPGPYPVKFDALLLAGTATAEALTINEIRAGLYDGVVNGEVRLDWRRQLTLSGTLWSRSINAERLTRLFSPGTRVSGQLNSESTLRYEASSLQTLFERPILQGRFSLNEGLLHNLDLAAPLKSAEPGRKRHGGQTAFNLFNGQLHYQAGQLTLSNLRLESGKFHARGDAVIRDGKLSGGASTTLASGHFQASTQLTLSGPLSAPEVQSGGAWRSPAPPLKDGP